MMLFNAVFALLVAYLANDYVVMQSPFIFSLIYVWSKKVPDAMMSIWGFPVQSVHLPWVLMGFHLFTGGNPFNDLIGVVVGHTYIFLKTILPGTHGYDLLKTPGFVVSMVERLNRIGGPQQGPRMHVVNNRDGQANPQAAQRQEGRPLNRNARD